MQTFSRSVLIQTFTVFFCIGGNINSQTPVLDLADYAHYVKKFNSTDPEEIVNLIPNSKAWDWMVSEIPLFDCPATQIEETYYFRWWSFRKHIPRRDYRKVADHRQESKA